MLRRQFVHRAALSMLASATGMLPGISLAEVKSWKAAFAEALEKTPWLLAFRSATNDAFSAEATLEGKIPEGLTGTLYRNGPGQHDFANSFFDGDGLVRSIAFREDGSRFVFASYS